MNEKTTQLAGIVVFSVFCYFMYSVYREYLEKVQQAGPPQVTVMVNGEGLENLVLDLYNKLKQEPVKETE